MSVIKSLKYFSAGLLILSVVLLVSCSSTVSSPENVENKIHSSGDIISDIVNANKSTSTVIEPSRIADTSSDITDTVNTKKNTNTISEPSKVTDKEGKISESEAIKIINDLIKQNKITLTEPESNCQIQNFGTTNKDNMSYHIIRIAYIDPNNKENTETLARYWISDTTKEVFQEDLWTGELSKIIS